MKLCGSKFIHVFAIHSFFAVLCFCAVSNVAAFAQDLDEVTIGGKITDQNGAALPGATVTAILAAEKIERTVFSNAEGRYKIIELKPGIYTVRVRMKGFADVEQQNLNTISGQNLQLNYTMTPAAVRAETVVINEETAAVIDTTRTVVGGTVTQREIEELPNVNRAPLDFVFTLGGVAEEPLSVRDAAEDRAFGTSTAKDPRPSPLESGIFSLSGGAAYSNNITIDGLDNNDDRLARERFQPSLDSIAEVQVITNQFSSEYGRASGGRVNIRTKAGTNKFRGRAYIYYRNSDFNANTYNNNRRGLSKLPFKEYNPGFTFGGPVPFWYFKNRTYFFSAFDNDDFRDTTRIDTIVPVESNPYISLPRPNNGNLRTESTRNIFAGYQPAVVGSYVQSIKTPSLKRVFTQRLDHNFTNNHNVILNYELERFRNTRQFRAAANRLEEAILGPTRNSQAFKFTDNLVITPQLINQFRFQYSEFKPNFASTNPTDPVVLVTLNDNTALPAGDQRNGTLIAGNSTASQNYNFPNTRRETRFQGQEILTLLRGNHSLKFGVDAQAIKSAYADLQDATGTFNFVSVRAFIDNRISQFRRNFGRNAVQKNTYSGWFAQDEWRAAPKLTLSFGLRFENETIIKDRNNFAPRLALAYAPFKENKTVLRAGFGIFYNRVLLRTFDDSTLTASRINYDSGRLAGPSNFNTDNCYTLTSGNASDYNSPKCQFLRQVRFPNVLTIEDLRRIEASLPAGQTGFVNASNNLRRLDPNLKVPESYQFNIGFERELFKGIVFEANYTYNKTIRLFREFNANAFNLPAGFKDYNDYLINGVTTGNIRFENGSPTAPDSRTVGGVTFWNLNSRNTSTATSAPVGVARAFLLANVGRKLNNNVNGSIDQVASIGNSLYNGLTLELRNSYRRFGHGFGASFRAAYTLSKLLDDGINNTTNAQSDADFKAEWSRGLQDRRHRFSFSGSFDTPRWLLGLRYSPILRLGSSAPFNLGNGGYDRNLNDNNNDRPNFSGNIRDIKYREPGAPYPQTLVEQFSFAPIGSAGNLPRNAGQGPRFFTFDFNVSREIKFGRGRDVRFRLRPNVEFDNIFNSRVFTFGAEYIDLTPNGTTQPDFLIPTRTLRPRQLRFGLRFDF
jgi:hypothetical protein